MPVGAATKSAMDAADVRETAETARIVELADASLQCGPHEAVELLEPESDETIVSVLSRGNPALADEILWAFSAQRRQRILAAAPANRRDQWSKNHLYPEDSIGRLMDPPVAVLRPEQTVGEVIERLRGIVKKALVTYGWVVDGAGRLQGVVVFRDLLFADDAQPISDIMVTQPYSLRPEMSLTEGMRDALARHFPVYPVCDGTGRLVGIVRGHSLSSTRRSNSAPRPAPWSASRRRNAWQPPGRAACAFVIPGYNSTC